ncbi:MAG: hypothetical protein U0414_12890 [Polyangiaceae bacterium]
MSDPSGGLRGRKVRKPAKNKRLPRAGVAIPIDTVADAAIAARAANEPRLDRCTVCGRAIAGDTHRGLLVWSRGEERRFEEPALCEPCATVLGISALSMWRRIEEEDE